VYLFKQGALAAVVSQLSKENQLALCFAVALLAFTVFHGEHDVIGLEMMYVEDCFENRQSVAVVDVSRVHWAFDALSSLLLSRL